MGKTLFNPENTMDQTLNNSPQDAVVNGKETSISLWCHLLPLTRTVSGTRLFALDGKQPIRTEAVTSLPLHLQAATAVANCEGFTAGSLNVPTGRMMGT